MVDETPRVHYNIVSPRIERWSGLSFAAGVVVGIVGVCLSVVILIALA